MAEFNPALANLEKPVLMRQFGLILENVDGFADPINRFVMRGVPHTLGLQVSLTRDTSLVNPPAEMTGWSGDGAPGTGSLREFAIGAVTQHFTRSLQRIEGRDFTLPSEHEFTQTQNEQIADFLRGVNTLQNMNGASRELDEILRNRNDPVSEQNTRLRTAFDETQDAIDVLTAPDPDLFPSALPRLTTARQRIAQAQNTTDPTLRRSLVQQAITELAGARDAVATIGL